ncbi:hypothetical protein ZIOFF_014011 [Zingiber officinale]|uniref:ARGOS-like protein n=1 Tax=Zingiber officinale TaxID=94328 RepID=A0A8J5HDD0_ZINOF|nr:hypothetical protein ZIOFF_014011 [Zingiber officinale]
MPLYWRGVPMEGRSKKNSFTLKPREPGERTFSKNYFSTESFLVLLCLTASLLILPLILPVLPPPPLVILLLPIGILVLLMIMAFMPSDVRKIASPCE